MAYHHGLILTMHKGIGQLSPHTHFRTYSKSRSSYLISKSIFNPRSLIKLLIQWFSILCIENYSNLYSAWPQESECRISTSSPLRHHKRESYSMNMIYPMRSMEYLTKVDSWNIFIDWSSHIGRAKHSKTTVSDCTIIEC